MHFLVIGLGSMGKRRIRLLKQIDSFSVITGVDMQESRRDDCMREWGINSYPSIEEACINQKIDCALVCTSPASHSSIINDCLNRGFHVFTELNLTDDMYKENIDLANKKDLTLFLSSTFIYREEMQYIHNLVTKSDAMLNYRYHIGQYLPDWHPWEDYRNYFVSKKKTNGCREILALELPWITKTFGDICDISVIKNKISNLDIDYEDTYMILVKHESGHMGSICVDIVSRKAVRNFELYGENIYLTWAGTPDSMVLYNIKEKKEEKISLYGKIDKQDKYAAFIIENAYRNELVAFLDSIINKSKYYDMTDDMNTLGYIDIIENDSKIAL